MFNKYQFPKKLGLAWVGAGERERVRYSVLLRTQPGEAVLSFSPCACTGWGKPYPLPRPTWLLHLPSSVPSRRERGEELSGWRLSSPVFVQSPGLLVLEGEQVHSASPPGPGREWGKRTALGSNSDSATYHLVTLYTLASSSLSFFDCKWEQ